MTDNVFHDTTTDRFVCEIDSFETQNETRLRHPETGDTYTLPNDAIAYFEPGIETGREVVFYPKIEEGRREGEETDKSPALIAEDAWVESVVRDAYSDMLRAEYPKSDGGFSNSFYIFPGETQFGFDEVNRGDSVLVHPTRYVRFSSDVNEYDVAEDGPTTVRVKSDESSFGGPARLVEVKNISDDRIDVRDGDSVFSILAENFDGDIDLLEVGQEILGYPQEWENGNVCATRLPEEVKVYRDTDEASSDAEAEGQSEQSETTDDDTTTMEDNPEADDQAEKGGQATDDATTTMNEETPEDTDELDSTDVPYDFIATVSDNRGAPEYSGTRWGLGSHSSVNQSELSTAFSDMMDELDEDVDSEVVEVLESAQSLVEDTQVRDFTCPVEECGLHHNHSDTKHDIRSEADPGFGVTTAFSDWMDFCPYCHCGVNELAMLMRFFPAINAEVFTDKDFSSVKSLNCSTLNNIYQQYQTDGDIKEAIETQNLMVQQEVARELKRFCDLRGEIEASADNAPIPSETRFKLNENREMLENALL